MQEVGKLIARPSSPIQTGDRVDAEMAEETGVDSVDQIQRMEQGGSFLLGEKKRNPHSPKPVDAPRQVPGPSRVIVAGTRPESPIQDQEIREKGDKCKSSCFPNHSTGGSAGLNLEAMWGIASSRQTPRKTLELAGRIEGKPWNLLIDSGSTGNYISAHVCTVNKLRKEDDPYPDQLTMADGSQVETTGRVQVQIKSGGYQGIVQAKIFPGLRKPMILGIPWLKKVNPHIDWAQETVVVAKGRELLSLPLARRKEKVEVNMVGAKKFSRLLRAGERAFVGFVRKVDSKQEECNVVGTGDVTSDLDSVLQSPKLPEPIKGVLREFSDVFPADLPVGKPPV